MSNIPVGLVFLLYRQWHVVTHRYPYQSDANAPARCPSVPIGLPQDFATCSGPSNISDEFM